MQFPIDVEVTTDEYIEQISTTYKILTELTFQNIKAAEVNAVKDIVVRTARENEPIELEKSNYDSDKEELKVWVTITETIEQADIQNVIESEIRRIAWNLHASAANIGNIQKEVE